MQTFWRALKAVFGEYINCLLAKYTQQAQQQPKTYTEECFIVYLSSQGQCVQQYMYEALMLHIDITIQLNSFSIHKLQLHEYLITQREFMLCVFFSLIVKSSKNKNSLQKETFACKS